MTRVQKGAVRIGLPITLLIGSMVGLGVNHEKIRSNEKQIEGKLTKEVFEEFKESNEKEHASMIEYLKAIHGKELPTK